MALIVLLDFKKLEMGAMNYDFVKTCINIPVEEAFRTMQHVAEQKGLKFELQLDPNMREAALTKTRSLK
ncbi:MAG: hypothetical protein GYA55_14855 [SAR324 cluster bacterium]|uniref:Uncharacterized protein n=1 Tax=SAR324 cluster bacterium TaxID=2024889 RepID=A0A7X9FU92_9DELT|nr:hypothetical protein [SAR324 cluster bacterium]